MNLEMQNANLIKFLDRLLFEVAVYRVLVEYAKLSLGSEFGQKMLRDARQNQTLRDRTKAYFEGFVASLPQSSDIDPDLALREFLTQLGSKQKPN